MEDWMFKVPALFTSLYAAQDDLSINFLFLYIFILIFFYYFKNKTFILMKWFRLLWMAYYIQIDTMEIHLYPNNFFVNTTYFNLMNNFRGNTIDFCSITLFSLFVLLLCKLY